MRPGAEAVYAGVMPDVATRAAVTAKLDIVEMRCLADPKHPDQLVLATVETPLAGVRLDPHRQIEHIAVGLLAGLE
jgi:hypothetical protein